MSLANHAACMRPHLYSPIYSIQQDELVNPEQRRGSSKAGKYVKYMQALKMYASSESARQLINSRLCLRRSGRLAYIWYNGTLTNEISTWNQLCSSQVWLSSLWGSLCSNKFLIAKASLFISIFLSLYCNVMLICRKCSWLTSDFNQG